MPIIGVTAAPPSLVKSPPERYPEIMKAITVLLILASAATAQVRQRTVRSVGEAVVSVQPDLVRVSVGVVTTAATAAAAAEQNASISDKVFAQVRAVIGPGGQLRTTSYSLATNFSQPTPGTPPQIVGFTVTNTLEATAADLTLAGRIIDAATGAGANRIGGVSFGVRDTSEAERTALTRAATSARDQARAMASGVGLSVGSVLSLEEGVVSGPSRALGIVDASAATRIEPGLIEVRATVTLEAELGQ